LTIITISFKHIGYESVLDFIIINVMYYNNKIYYVILLHTILYGKTLFIMIFCWYYNDFLKAY